MSVEASVSQNAVQVSGKDEKEITLNQTKLQGLIESLRSVQDDIGQIGELSSEEKILVTKFFEALLKLMQPLAATMPISIEVLPAEMGDVAQANIDPTGHLIVLHRNGQVELENLNEEKNRDLMMIVVEDVMPKFKQLTSTQKRKIENRISFLSAVTMELQKISKALSTFRER
ncbi:hypothetical protein MUO79_08560 [Candidatus Bathyarchaeota archaeon]|jgi:hypothetical protein|nr:hypothetical protein [Candidatus Bathyarchaeota archaeon]